MTLKLLSFDENGALRSTVQTETELRNLGILDLLSAGECVFVGGRWVFPESIRTLRGPATPISEVRFWQGFDPSDGSPGSCDVHYLCARSLDTDELIKRAVHVIAKGIEGPALAGVAGQIG